MNKIRNKIITISGEPVSGKSTVVKAIKEKYENMGYRVHIITTGQVFRETIKKEYAKMYPDKVDANLADIQADETFAEKRGEIDGIIDTWIAQKGEEINFEEREKDVYIIDSRLAWHNIPNSFAVRLTVDEKIAGERVFKDTNRGNEDTYATVEEAVEKTKQRKIGEIERYKERYGVDLTEPENYDLIVDTSFSNTDELAQIIIEGEKSYREEKYYPKMWASPACLIGTQSDRETDTGFGNIQLRPADLAKKMEREGFNPQLGEITVVQDYGEKYVVDGHHRAMAVLAMGKTLVPYRIEKSKKVSDRINGEKNNLWFAYDWADLIRNFGGNYGKQEQFKDFQLKDLTAYNNRIKLLLEKVSNENDER